jgi:hypothetical protein
VRPLRLGLRLALLRLALLRRALQPLLPLPLPPRKKPLAQRLLPGAAAVVALWA